MSDGQRLGAISAQLVQAGLAGGNPFRFRIVTDSMRPSLLPGDDVIVQQVAWQNLRMGDVVLCDSGRMLVAHRLLGIRSHAGEPLLVTKGDANWRVDAPYELRAYRGKVVRVERGGARFIDLDSPRARLVARVRAGSSLGQAMLMQLYRKLKSRLGVALLLSTLLLACVTSALAAVTISSFSATGGNNQIKLNWSTATELKNFAFNVERSTDQSHWSKIGTVNSQSPCVQSLDTLNYSYTDSNLLAGTKYYYRLQMVGSPCGDPDQYYAQTVNATTNGTAPAGTPTPTPPPTNTPTATSKAGAPTATRTNTHVPPTATRTITPVPPTATGTNTPIPPTATATNTSVVPSATPTNTPLPTATPSITPAATATATSPTAPSPVPTALPAYPLPAIVSPTPVVPAPTDVLATPTTGAPSTDATTAPAAPTEVALVVPTTAPANTGASGAQGTTPEGPVDPSAPGAPAQNTPQAGSPLNLVVPLAPAVLGFTLLAVAGILLWRQRRLSAPQVPQPPTDET